MSARGGKAGGTHNYVDKYFRLPQQNVPKRIWQLWVVQKLLCWGGGGGGGSSYGTPHNNHTV